VTTLVEAGLAMPGANQPAVTHFAVAVEASRIVGTGPAAELRARYPAAERVGGGDHVLLPAMVDSHDHGRGPGSLALGIPDDLLEVWLVHLAAQLPIDPYLLAAYDGLRLVRCGVSTVLHSHNRRDLEHVDQDIEETLRGYRDVGIRVVFDLPIVDQNRLAYVETEFLKSLPPERAATLEQAQRSVLDPATYFELCARLLRERHDPEGMMVQVCMGPSGPQWCSDELMAECLTFARQHGVRMHVHALETWYQREYAFRSWGMSLSRHLDSLGLLGPWLTLAHAIWLEPEDISLLAERGVGVAHNPSSNLRLRSGIAPVPSLIEAGVQLGVGLDGQALDDDQDYLRELRLAWTLTNRPGASAKTVPPQRIWEMGTTGGAAITLGPEAPLGRLEPGYFADLVLLERGTGLNDWSVGLDSQASAADMLELLPGLLLRSASRRHVRDVMINGTWVVRDGRSTRLDEREITSALRDNVRAEATATRVRPQATLSRDLRDYYAGWGNPGCAWV
jgi:5-methylthioadenosine/S-adenosylhomocysteine deaminase